MDKCIWIEGEEDWYAAGCENNDEKEFYLHFLMIRNFNYCPYCSKKIKFIHNEFFLVEKWDE